MNDPLAVDSNHSWKELNYDEKVERMHDVVRTLVNKITLLQRDIEQMKQHHHDKDGDPAITKKIGRLRTDYELDQPVSTPVSSYQNNYPEDAYF